MALPAGSQDRHAIMLAYSMCPEDHLTPDAPSFLARAMADPSTSIRPLAFQVAVNLYIRSPDEQLRERVWEWILRGRSDPPVRPLTGLYRSARAPYAAVFLMAKERRREDIPKITQLLRASDPGVIFSDEVISASLHLLTGKFFDVEEQLTRKSALKLRQKVADQYDAWYSATEGLSDGKFFFRVVENNVLAIGECESVTRHAYANVGHYIGSDNCFSGFTFLSSVPMERCPPFERARELVRDWWKDAAPTLVWNSKDRRFKTWYITIMRFRLLLPIPIYCWRGKCRGDHSAIPGREKWSAYFSPHTTTGKRKRQESHGFWRSRLPVSAVPTVGGGEQPCARAKAADPTGGG